MRHDSQGRTRLTSHITGVVVCRDHVLVDVRPELRAAQAIYSQTSTRTRASE